MSGSLRARLTAVIAVVFAAVLVTCCILLYAATRRAAWDQHDAGLTGRAQAIAASAEFDEGGYEVGLPPQNPGPRPAYIEVWQPDGNVLARSASLGERDLSPALVAGTDPVFADVTLPDGRTGRGVALRFLPRAEPHAHPGQLSIVLAEGTEDVDAAVASVRSWFLVLGLGALIAVVALTAWSISRGLRPLARLGQELEHIDDRHLRTRLASRDQPRELQAAVHKLEDLLARLDASFARERQFTADVSHELRTPLAGLRTVLEVAALTWRSPAEYRASLVEALAIVQQMSTLVENLLTLARFDTGEVQIESCEVQVRPLVEQCWAPYAELAGERALEFRNRVGDDFMLTSDPEQLRIVLGNLLANAAEYTTASGWIEVRSGPGSVMEVVDSGPPIAGEQLEHLFDRFVRGDAARAATGIHCGIGLALSRAVCARLQLSLTAACSPAGEVSFRLEPAAHSSSMNLPSSANVASLRPEPTANASS